MFRAIVAALFAAGLAAQEAEPQTEPVSRVARAIADYQSVAKDPAKAAQRRHAIVWVGEIDDPAATAFLQEELVAAGDGGFLVVVIEAVAKVARPALQPALRAVLERASAPLAARVAAAGAIVRLGDRAMDSLLEMAGAPEAAIPQAQRDAAIAALVDSGIDRALRGLVPLLLDGPWPARVKLLRRLEDVHGLAPLDAARIRLAQEGELETAAVAWRQLAVGKHERAKALAVDVLERIVGDPRPAIAAELIGGLVRVRDEDLYPVLLRFGAISAEPVKKALRAAAPAVPQDPALLKWLVTKGLEDANPGARDAAKMLLLEAPAEALRPLLDRIRADIRAGKKKALDLAVGLHELLAKDPSWRTDLAALAASNDVEHRLLGLSMLNELGSDAGIVTAQQSLGHKAWEVRSLALRYLAKCRDVASIPLLIARYGKEDGRLGAELDQALFMHTGKRCISRREWETWWEKNKTGFVLPRAETVAAAKSSASGNTVAYHDIAVTSNRVAFLIDRSGSMSARIGTDKKLTRLDVAKEQFVKVVEALPATHHVNLIAYETKVMPLWTELRTLDDDNRALLVKTARVLPLGQGTNIFDALELAFADPKVDTIFLLTDGEPSVGKVVAPEAILEEVRRWNRTRQIVIHCIGLGIDSELLKRLAADTGGQYRCVK